MIFRADSPGGTLRATSALVVLLAIAVPRPVGAAPAALSFQDAYEKAKSATQRIDIRDAALEQSRARLSQARGSFLPEISAIGSYTRQHAPDGSETGVSGAFQRADQRTVRIAANQPIFRGLAEFAGLNAASSDVDQQVQLKRQETLDLQAAVGQAFHDVLAAEADVADLTRLLRTTERRVSELRERVRVGRSRQAELLQARTQVASAGAQLEAARARLELARARFEQISGLPAASELQDTVNVPGETPPLAGFLESVEERPDVLAARHALEAAESGVTIARAGHLPSIDASANYYLERTGILEPVKWDLGVTLTLPLFSGGTVSSRVKAAAQGERIAVLQLEQLRRQARTEIASQHSRFQRAQTQLRALEAAADTARRNYEGLSRDFSLGLVTNLEVIQALNDSVQVDRSLNGIRYDLKAAWIALHSVTGKELR